MMIFFRYKPFKYSEKLPPWAGTFHGYTWTTNQLCYLHNAAISLGRSAPNRPKRWLLASRSKGEWLRMELKVNGYIARGNSVMWRSWCSLLVAIMKSAVVFLFSSSWLLFRLYCCFLFLGRHDQGPEVSWRRATAIQPLILMAPPLQRG